MTRKTRRYQREVWILGSMFVWLAIFSQFPHWTQHNVIFTYYKPGIYEYKHSLTFRVRRHVVIATKFVHRLQIRPIVHNQGAPATVPSSYIRFRAVLWACGEGQTHTDTRGRYTFRVVYTTHAKCNNEQRLTFGYNINQSSNAAHQRQLSTEQAGGWPTATSLVRWWNMARVYGKRTWQSFNQSKCQFAQRLARFPESSAYIRVRTLKTPCLETRLELDTFYRKLKTYLIVGGTFRLCVYIYLLNLLHVTEIAVK